MRGAIPPLPQHVFKFLEAAIRWKLKISLPDGCLKEVFNPVPLSMACPTLKIKTISFTIAALRRTPR
jgi:hypothetical protein